MKKAVLITLTYNKLEEATKPYLESLYEYTDESLFDLVIVDNASSDGTVGYLREFAKNHSNVKLIENFENLGYSGGNNIGLRYIKDMEYEFVGLLNNDILFTPNWLEDTIDIFSKDSQLGMVSPRIQKGRGKWGEININNYLQKYKKYLNRFKDDFTFSLEPLFCCIIIKKEVTDSIGLMDENFSPAFWEDNDYCFRTMYAGYSLARSNRTFVYHNHGTTSSAVKSEIFERNKQYFFKKHPLGKWIWAHKRSNLFKDIKRYITDSFN